MLLRPPFGPDAIESINDYQDAVATVSLMCEKDPSHGPLRAHMHFLSCNYCHAKVYSVPRDIANWTWLNNFLSAR